MTREDRLAKLPDLLKDRILVLDGAMGTAIQGHKLDEAGYRGDRFADWGQDVKGNNDLLTLTRPDIIRDIQVAYLEAGRRHPRNQHLQFDHHVARPTTAWRRWCAS